MPNGVRTFPDARVTQAPAAPSTPTWMTSAPHDWLAHTAMRGVIGFEIDRRFLNAAAAVFIKVSLFDVRAGSVYVTQEYQLGSSSAAAPSSSSANATNANAATQPAIPILGTPLQTTGDGQLKTLTFRAESLVVRPGVASSGGPWSTDADHPYDFEVRPRVRAVAAPAVAAAAAAAAAAQSSPYPTLIPVRFEQSTRLVWRSRSASPSFESSRTLMRLLRCRRRRRCRPCRRTRLRRRRWRLSICRRGRSAAAGFVSCRDAQRVTSLRLTTVGRAIYGERRMAMPAQTGAACVQSTSTGGAGPLIRRRTW